MIILMGLAGSGKSTQGQILAEETGRLWLSAGQVLRDIPNEKVHELQEHGELIPDAVVIPLMTEVIAQTLARGEDVVLDGYPRTVEQAEWIAENAADRVEAVLRINVPKAELIQRMQKRGREDDRSLEAIEERFRLIEQNIYSICEILTEKGVRIVDIDGVGTVEQVAERIKQALIEAKNE